MYIDATTALTYALVSVVTAAIVLLIFRHVSYDMGSREEINTFRIFLLIFLVFVVANGVCIWTNYNRLRVMGSVFTAINQCALCAAAYFWLIYIETRLNPERARDEFFRYFALIPMMSLIILIGSSPSTHLIFYYDDNGTYCRGPMYILILVASFIYLTLAMFEARARIRYAKTKSQRGQIYYLMLFTVFPVMAGVIDLLHAHLPSMELVVLFGIVLIYLNLQQEQVYRDALTGLNNRRLTDEYLAERIPFVKKEYPLYYFLSDIDSFKEINDKYGHLEGDNALKLVAEELKRFTDIDHYFISRWGGDEFVMIIDQDDAFDPEVFKKRVNDAMHKASVDNNLAYEVHLSMGYVKCTDPEMSIDSILNTADQYMYMEKKGRSKASSDVADTNKKLDLSLSTNI